MVDLGGHRHLDASERVRVAQQLGTLSSIPPLAVAALVSFNLFIPSAAYASTAPAGQRLNPREMTS
jgi:hypothetical protein